MEQNSLNLPPIPVQRYFTEKEVCELVKISLTSLRMWAAKQTDLLGDVSNRFYLRHHVLLLRRIRDQIHNDGFAIEASEGITALQVKVELESISDILKSKVLNCQNEKD